jgi:hypothetical protein
LEAAASDKNAEFVKEVHDDACRIFGAVLGAAANAAHKNHFPLDMKERALRTGAQGPRWVSC